MSLESGLSPVGPADDSTSVDVRRARPSGGLPSWILLLAVAAGALALVAAHLPPICKKLGLYGIAYGALVGLIGAWLSQFSLSLRGRIRSATVLVFLLALCGQIGIAVESYRIDRSDQRRRERADPKQLLARRLLDSASEPSDAKSKATFDEFRRSYGASVSSFSDYLLFRVSGIGIQSKWAAAVFWGVEITLGGLAAGWVFVRGVDRSAFSRETGVG